MQNSRRFAKSGKHERRRKRLLEKLTMSNNANNDMGTVEP